MNTAYVTNGELINHDTIKLKEPVPFENSEVTVILEPKVSVIPPKQENLLKLAELRGKVEWEGSLDELRKSRI